MTFSRKNCTAEELLEILNDSDECSWMEAKNYSNTSNQYRMRSLMETICSFSNEPGLGGGFILLGISENERESSKRYSVSGVSKPDEVQSNVANECNNAFNIPVRPEISVEKIHGKTVLKIWINELSPNQKPLYFKNEGLPRGAWRRIGSCDQKCSEDDLRIFYQAEQNQDQQPVKGALIEEADTQAIQYYRRLREKVNPVASELMFTDQELLEALGCINPENKMELNLTGVLIFGSDKLLRRTLPTARVDYIRVPGNKWIGNFEETEEEFRSIDMRGPLLLLVNRIVEAVYADLPKGFVLREGEIQAQTTGLPMMVLREALVNAMMHRSYREHQPIQVIRYDNRLEIVNVGFSLKSEEELGNPGSMTRNPHIAAIFHDTQLAETKGSGIRRMQNAMKKARFAPPTFESSREKNQFTVRLLLHHFLSDEDLKWLESWGRFQLNDSQKTALIFLRETGAIDNSVYRQIASCDTLNASYALRKMRDDGLLELKGKGSATYYVPGPEFLAKIPESTNQPARDTNAPARDTNAPDRDTNAPDQNANAPDQNANAPVQNANAPVQNANAPVQNANAPVQNANAPVQDANAPLLQKINSCEIPNELQARLNSLPSRVDNPAIIMELIQELCSLRAMSVTELAKLLKRKQEKFLIRKYLTPMIQEGKLNYTHPENVNHPNQEYISNKK